MLLKKDAASTGIVTVIGAVDSGANLVLSSPGDFVTVVNTGSDWKTMAKLSLFLPLRGQLPVLAGRPQELILLEQQMRMILL
jgi:hypothetical protein